ncbi:WYL domain-containing protein, partial [Streptomyces sp. NPDC051172]|uniref:WYL domain-containing protein n=1 Tax=Streptomyces sp. NPDC051172 TaxID=3155796 RepID=UPI003441811E
STRHRTRHLHPPAPPTHTTTAVILKRSRKRRCPAPDPYNGVPFSTDTEEIIAGYATQVSHTDVRQLAHAVDSGTAVTIEYVATTGSRTIRTISGLDLDPPYLHAWCHLRDAERVFTLSRIHGVMPPG